MGKIRVKTLGDEEAEKDQKKEASKRQEAKKVGKAPGLKGGQRINAVGPTEEELQKLDEAKATEASSLTSSEQAQEPKKEKKAKTKKSKARERSTRYKEALINVDRTKNYALQEALELLAKVHLAKYDETVELHINTTETLSGTVSLPHGTGKQIRVAIATDELLKEIEAGKINFDVLLAQPAFMGKLAKVARVLGPKGLMPNPKTGTITPNPEETAKKYAGGLMAFKTEAKAPILHVSVGKLSFGDKKLSENIKTLLTAVKKEKIRNAVLKSTMSPGIKIDVLSI